MPIFLSADPKKFHNLLYFLTIIKIVCHH